MLPVRGFNGLFRPGKNASWFILFLVFSAQALSMSCRAALPRRLVLLVDGVAYRDIKALQGGVSYIDLHGHQYHRQAFNQSYFPVSRLISTFPSISDPSWSEIMANQPPAGYQRTYFDATQDREIFLNGVTSSDEYETQMSWQMTGGYHRFLGYVAPQKAFRYEVDSLVSGFLQATNGQENYYVLIHCSDSAQHLSGDIFAMMSTLDERLQRLREVYRTREGRELEILLLSDHGNNHAGGGKRIAVQSFLKHAGYHITKSLKEPNDVVLPTAGIESWIEIHNSPAKTEALAELLTHLKGVDIVTAQLPGRTNQFLILNSTGERAIIDWDPGRNAFRYSPVKGDPINYLLVIGVMKRDNTLDADGFASADAWMNATFTQRYPDALERIVQGHTRVTQNPATIIVGLKNGYIHSGWLIKRGADLTKCGGTHGALDDLNSDGILLSTFAPTHDTTTSRVAKLYGGFQGRRSTALAGK